jgi:hypothetical protein
MKEGLTMAKARKAKEISFTMPNKAGLLSEVSRAIAGAGVNITAICAYAMGDTAYFMLTTASNVKAKKALVPLSVAVEERDVVEVELLNRPGELQKVAKRIANAGIDIEYMYATAGAGKSTTCVFKTADDKNTIKVINK